MKTSEIVLLVGVLLAVAAIAYFYSQSQGTASSPPLLNGGTGSDGSGLDDLTGALLDASNPSSLLTSLIGG
jgi:hypothetical protein